MPTYTTDNIPKPASGDGVTPLEGHFQSDADATQAALDTYKIKRVANEAALPAVVSGRYLIAQAIDTGWIYYSDGTAWYKMLIPGSLASRQNSVGLYAQSADPGASTVGAGAIWARTA